MHDPVTLCQFYTMFQHLSLLERIWLISDHSMCSHENTGNRKKTSVWLHEQIIAGLNLKRVQIWQSALHCIILGLISNNERALFFPRNTFFYICCHISSLHNLCQLSCTCHLCLYTIFFIYDDMSRNRPKNWQWCGTHQCSNLEGSYRIAKLLLSPTRKNSLKV